MHILELYFSYLLFCKGSNIANEADNVVQMFLMSMTNRQNFSSPDQTVALDDQANNKTILAQMRKDFFTTQQQSPEQKEQRKVTNKYLKPENRYVPPVPQTLSTSNTNAEDQVVQSFVAPQMHHAEVVHVRQDSTSTEASMEASFDTQVSHYEEGKSQIISFLIGTNFDIWIFRRSKQEKRLFKIFVQQKVFFQKSQSGSSYSRNLPRQ